METYGNTENASDDARLITEHEAAELLTLSIKTLRNWRLSGNGPPHLKVGRLGPLPPKRSQSLAQNLRAFLDKRPRGRPCLIAPHSIPLLIF